MKIKRRQQVERVVELVKGEEGRKGNDLAGQDQEEGMMRNVLYGAMLGAGSVMDLETVMTPYQKSLGVRWMSDSLIHRPLDRTSAEQVRRRCYQVHRKMQEEGMFRTTLADGREIRLERIDGFQIMTHDYEALVVSGKVKAGIDYEPCTKGGNECVAALPLLCRAKENGIELDLLTGDGITYNGTYWKEVRAQGMAFFTSVRSNDGRGLVLVKETDVLIKTDEQSPIGFRQVKTAGIVYGDARYAIHVVSQ